MGRKTLQGEHLVTSATVISKDEIKQVLDQYLATVSPIYAPAHKIWELITFCVNALLMYSALPEV